MNSSSTDFDHVAINNCNKRIKIAYVEPQQLIQKGISSLINTFIDCQVVYETSNCLELIQALPEFIEFPNLCILNVFNPGMNTNDAIRNIKQEWPTIKILVLLDNDSYYLNTLLLEAGVNGILKKNCSVYDFEQAIEYLYATGSLRNVNTPSPKQLLQCKSHQKLPEFTLNEIALLKYSCSDLSYTQIADKMGTTMHSVDWYRNSLFKKLGVKSRSSLVMFAIQIGLVNPEIASIE